MLVPHFEHKLFLTATPHNGYQESFTALLELLDSQRFARRVSADRNQLQVVMVRRLKGELPPKWDGTPRFPKRELEAIPVDYLDAERRANAALRQYTESRRKGATDNTELYATEFVLKLLKKRLFSCPAAFLTTLEQHERSLISANRRSTKGLSKPTVGILRRQLEQIEEEFADDQVYEESTEDAIASTSRLIHYEIPWNPNRMEQRNGRIDRHGQKASEVSIYHFVGKGYEQQAIALRAAAQPIAGFRAGDLEGDLEFLMRAAIRARFADPTPRLFPLAITYLIPQKLAR